MDTLLPATDQRMYLAPELLTPHEANEKARPGETPEERAGRVASMTTSIRANGQEYPVLIVGVTEEGSDVTTYQYVDGGCRVEAIGALNAELSTPAHEGEPVREVWVSLVEPTADLYRKALVGNLHRTQNSIMQMAQIVQEVGERHGWKGKGAQQKIAEYLGLGVSRVSEYQKILRAAPEVKAQIESGAVSSMEAALALSKVADTAPEKVGQVAGRASELARDEQAAEEIKAEQKAAREEKKLAKKEKREPNPRPPVPAFVPGKHKPNVAKVKTKHVEQAKREAGVAGAAPTKAEIVSFFEIVSMATYGPKTVAFCEYLVKWAGGEKGTTAKRLRDLFDAAVAGDKVVKQKKAPMKAEKKPKAAAKKAAPKKKVKK